MHVMGIMRYIHHEKTPVVTELCISLSVSKNV